MATRVPSRAPLVQIRYIHKYVENQTGFYLRVDVVQELQVQGILFVVACAAVVGLGGSHSEDTNTHKMRGKEARESTLGGGGAGREERRLEKQK